AAPSPLLSRSWKRLSGSRRASRAPSSGSQMPRTDASDGSATTVAVALPTARSRRPAFSACAAGRSTTPVGSSRSVTYGRAARSPGWCCPATDSEPSSSRRTTHRSSSAFAARAGLHSRSSSIGGASGGVSPRSPIRDTPTTIASQSALRTALAGLIGNVLEWFDFAVFGYFAGDIGAQFFPQTEATVRQLYTFGTFAIGFFARPIGGLALGYVGDRIGRRALLTLSIALMGGATLAIGLLPTYRQIGVAAPLLLVLLRLVQGFSLGGEFTGSMVYTTQPASSQPPRLVSSATAAGTTLGFILGSITAWAVNRALGASAASAWGWRVPFVLSVVFCIAGWLLRRGIHESEAGEKAAAERPPILASLVSDIR